MLHAFVLGAATLGVPARAPEALSARAPESGTAPRAGVHPQAGGCAGPECKYDLAVPGCMQDGRVLFIGSESYGSFALRGQMAASVLRNVYHFDATEILAPNGLVEGHQPL